MNIFAAIKKKYVSIQTDDEYFYSLVAKELDQGIRHDGLWLKALAQADGDRDRQHAEYVKLRIKTLRREGSSNPPGASAAVLPLPNGIEDDVELAKKVEKLIQRLECDDDESIRLSLAGYDGPQLERLLNTYDACEQLPLHRAIQLGRYELVEFFLVNGADPYRVNYWGHNALEVAKGKHDDAAMEIVSRLAGYDS